MYIKKFSLLLATWLSLTSLSLFAQIKPSSAAEIATAIQQRVFLQEHSLLRQYPVRSIGPTVQGGRITDIEVTSNPKIFYVAYASGGLFKTVNNGISFEPVFDGQGALGIGDIAIAPSDDNIIWVGTGENNSSRSSYAGAGVYKSTDGGTTWQHMGLTHSQHIGRIIIHPQNPDIVWVASMGALYTTNEERGIFKTTDGGRTWQHVLYINDRTGVIDLIIHPDNPDRLWAAAWERIRRPWHFTGSGKNSAIYASTDGGNTWTKSMEGIPQGEKTGRIGLAICKHRPNILYALLDNLNEKQEEKKPDTVLSAKDFLKMSVTEFLALDEARIDTFLRKNQFPKKYNATVVKEEIRKGKYTPKALADYLGDANTALFETEVIGAELYRSEDNGKTWQKVNTYDLKGVYFTYGYYFGEIRVDPQDCGRIYVLGVPLLVSRDSGKTFARLDTFRVHVDHHALWINDNYPQHIILGNDGGLYISYDAGANWWHANNTAVGQFYTVAVDMETPYNVYGGTQDNGVLFGSSQSVPNRTKDWETIMWGDGMFVAVDPDNSKIVYTGYQFGNYFRLDRTKNETKRITPQHDIGEPPLRFNWRTPLVMNKHNPKILYIGAQKIYRTLNGGETWEAISPDLTTNRQPQGNVPYSTITCIAESPLKFGLIWVGTDDGNIQLTRNGGWNWQLVSTALPSKRWISSICASPHDEAIAYIALNGYREDEFKTYIYKTTDYGKSWISLKGNLPDEPVNVILQDPVNPRLLYCGTDHGAYISLNDGKMWERIAQLPNVAVYDMVVHPRDNELVIATHGRSIYIMDVKPLQALKENKIDFPLVAFEPKTVLYSDNWGKSRYPYLPPEEPTLDLMYYIGKRKNEKVIIEVMDETKTMRKRMEVPAQRGINVLKWDLKLERSEQLVNDNETILTEYIVKGKYTIVFRYDDIVQEVQLLVK